METDIPSPNFYGYVCDCNDKEIMGTYIFYSSEIALHWLSLISKVYDYATILLTDANDYILAEVSNGLVVFPEELIKAQEEGRF